MARRVMAFVFQSGPKLKQGIELTPLMYVPGARIEHYLGHLNFFIIRETTSVREASSVAFAIFFQRCVWKLAV